jgi:hypothetical protein
MIIRSIRNLSLYYLPGEEETAGIVEDACEKSLDLIDRLWRFQAPGECRLYVMDSWPRFLFHSAPWHWRIYLALTLPLRFSRIQKLWKIAGGWALRYGSRRVIGVKPARLLEGIEPGFRNKIFIQRNAEDWVRHNTCHELTHASSDHLRLPTWLHEGLAMVTVDHLAGKPTVKSETLEALEKHAGSKKAQKGSRGITTSVDELVYMAVRGYWITRFLFETQPGLLKEQLFQPQSHSALESELAAGSQIPQGEFMEHINRKVLTYFQTASI